MSSAQKNLPEKNEKGEEKKKEEKKEEPKPKVFQLFHGF